MAVNPTYGPIVNKLTSDPAGEPGQTKGGVPATDSTTRMRMVGDPNAGQPPGQPVNPSKNPTEETYGPPPDVGPDSA